MSRPEAQEFGNDRSLSARTCRFCKRADGTHADQCPLSSGHFQEVMQDVVRVAAQDRPDQEKGIRDAKELVQRTQEELDRLVTEEEKLTVSLAEKTTDRLTQWIGVMKRVAGEIGRTEAEYQKAETHSVGHFREQDKLLKLRTYQQHLLRVLEDGIVSPEEESLLRMEGLQLEKDGSDLLHQEARLEEMKIQKAKLESIIAALSPVIGQYDQSVSESEKLIQPMSDAEKQQRSERVLSEVESSSVEFEQIQDAKEFRHERREKLNELKSACGSLNDLGLKMVSLNFANNSPERRAETTTEWSEIKKQRADLMKKIGTLRKELRKKFPSFLEIKIRLESERGFQFSEAESRDLLLLDVEQSVRNGDFSKLTLDQTWLLDKKGKPKNISEAEAQNLLSAFFCSDASIEDLTKDPLKTIFSSFEKKPWYKDLWKTGIRSQLTRQKSSRDKQWSKKIADSFPFVGPEEKGLVAWVLLNAITEQGGELSQNLTIAAKFKHLVDTGYAKKYPTTFEKYKMIWDQGEVVSPQGSLSIAREFLKQEWNFQEVPKKKSIFVPYRDFDSGKREYSPEEFAHVSQVSMEQVVDASILSEKEKRQLQLVGLVDAVSRPDISVEVLGGISQNVFESKPSPDQDALKKQAEEYLKESFVQALLSGDYLKAVILTLQPNVSFEYPKWMEAEKLEVIQKIRELYRQKRYCDVYLYAEDQNPLGKNPEWNLVCERVHPYAEAEAVKEIETLRQTIFATNTIEFMKKARRLLLIVTDPKHQEIKEKTKMVIDTYCCMHAGYTLRSYLFDKEDQIKFADYLDGVNTPEAWQLRLDYLSKNSRSSQVVIDMRHVLSSFRTIDNPRATDFCRIMLTKGVDPKLILAHLEGKKARGVKELRQEIQEMIQ
jgi:hypothetical protein